MNVFKIAWRSVQHRGFGSFLTILSMSLGVMLVVSVLSIHGLISDSFRNNSSFGYNILVGARGGGLQLTMNTVYYLSQPVENIPYEYYLAFCDQETREKELRHSIAFKSFEHELDCLDLMSNIAPGAMAVPHAITSRISEQTLVRRHVHQTRIDKRGLYKPYTDLVIPLCLGDTYPVEGTETFFRCVGTKPAFFEKLVLNYDTKEKFQFVEGRCFEEDNAENGFYECVVGAIVAKRAGLKIGDLVYPTHGDPNDTSAHVHEQGFKVVGILQGTRTPNDRAIFLNMEGFYLMEGHSPDINEEDVLSTGDDTSEEDLEKWEGSDQWGDDDDEISETPFGNEPPSDKSPASQSETTVDQPDTPAVTSDGKTTTTGFSLNQREPLPIEQREVTSLLVLTKDGDPILAYFLPPQIDQGNLESTLDWSNFRPIRSQKAAQAVNPVEQVTLFFYSIIDPIRWLLLALTVMICIVSAISILVGIYNSMSQRRHEIAVMRALGASRNKVMAIMLSEAFLLAFAGGFFGWVAGHTLNVVISPIVEAKTGVGISFFELAPSIPMFGFLLGESASFLPDWILESRVSPELLLVPGLILLAMFVGIYPAISAYRTDVAKSLGK